MQDETGETKKKTNCCFVLTVFLVVAMAVAVFWVLVQDFIKDLGC